MDPFSIVTSGISTLSNLFGNIASQNNADNANRLSVQLQRENNQFNHDEAELAYQRQIDQWQRETGYNSPIEQVKRLQQAGLNPALLYGGYGPTNVAASSHVGSQASSASSGISPQLPTLMPVFSGREFSDIAKGLVEAKKTGLDVKEASATLQSRIEAWRADAEMKATAAHLQSVYGEALQQQQLAEGFERVTLLAEQAKNAAKEGLNIEADTYLKKMEAQLSDMQKQVKEKERDNWKLKNDVFMDDFRASLGLKKAQTYEANANAKITTEQFNELKHKNDWFKFLDTGKDAEVNPYRSYIFGLLEEAASKNALNDAEVKKIKDLLPHLVEQAQSDAAKGKPWTWTYFVDKLCNIAGSTAGNALLLLLK